MNAALDFLWTRVEVAGRAMQGYTWGADDDAMRECDYMTLSDWCADVEFRLNIDVGEFRAALINYGAMKEGFEGFAPDDAYTLWSDCLEDWQSTVSRDRHEWDANDIATLDAFEDMEPRYA